MLTREDVFANKIFLNAVLPLVKVIVYNDDSIKQKFESVNAIIQISAKDMESKVGTHYNIENGEWTVIKGVIDKPTIELEFKSISAFNAFFSGKSSKPPKIRGWYNIKLLINTLKVLMRVANLLKTTEIPEDEEEKDLLVQLYFYLLSSGISQLNKAEHPEVSKWAKRSPERVYGWSVQDKPQLSAYIKVKAGKTKAARGEYQRSKPFFKMHFDSVDSALGILLEIDDMIDSTTKGKLVMEGAPEYGAQIGELMLLVGSYAK